MDTEDSQNCVPKQQKHLCLLPVSLFIFKAPGTASSFSFQYLKVTGNQSIQLPTLWSTTYGIWRTIQSWGATEDALCFFHWWFWWESFVTQNLYLFHHFPEYLSETCNLLMAKIKNQTCLFSVKPKGRIYKPKTKCFALFRC